MTFGLDTRNTVITVD